MRVPGLLLLAGVLSFSLGCSDEDTFTDCRTFTQIDDEGVVVSIEECCVTQCEEDFDGDVDCSTECTCTVEGTTDRYLCPGFDDFD
jgi:hypothetical protein